MLIILFLSAALLMLAAATGYLFRPLWFDEALTLLNFAALPDAGAIYNAYVIPNNQILHSILLHLLVFRWEVPLEYLRFFPFLCAIITVAWLYAGFRKECGSKPLAAVLAAWMFSAPFLLYATALRGYMAAALAVTAALICGRKFAVSGKISALAAWSTAVGAAVAIMPSALAGVAAAGLFILPYFGRRFYCKKRFYALALSVPVIFALIYLPIADNVLHAFSLKEGWRCAAGAHLALILAMIATFNVLLIPAVRQIFKRKPVLRTLAHLAVWLLPLGMWIFPVAPFPRVWWVIFPVLAVTLARSLCKLKVPVFCWTLPAAISAILTLTPAARELWSRGCVFGGQDDFFAPYFIRSDFTPHHTAAIVRTIGHAAVFVSFNADPWALMMTLDEPLLFDAPSARPVQLPDRTVVITSRSEAPLSITSRFGGSMTLIRVCGQHNIYLWRK